MKDFWTRFGHAETNPPYARATFLDPRFKKKGFANEGIYAQVHNDVKGTVANKISTAAAAAANDNAAVIGSETSTMTAGKQCIMFLCFIWLINFFRITDRCSSAAEYNLSFVKLIHLKFDCCFII